MEPSKGLQGLWFCAHSLPWDKCQTFLPSERAALQNFLEELGKTPLPPAASGDPRNDTGVAPFAGRGVVMSGGKPHVLMALANLFVLREVLGSEFVACL